MQKSTLWRHSSTIAIIGFTVFLSVLFLMHFVHSRTDYRQVYGWDCWYYTTHLYTGFDVLAYNCCERNTDRSSDPTKTAVIAG